MSDDHADRAEILDALPELLTADCITLERHADGTATATIVAEVEITEAGLAGPAQRSQTQNLTFD